MRSLIGLLGRICISAIFILSIMEEMSNWQDSEQRILQCLTVWQGYGQPGLWLETFIFSLISWIPFLFLLFLLLKVLGSLFILLGWKVRLGSFLLVLCILPSIIGCQTLWNEGTIQQREITVGLIKNIAILGALFLLIGYYGNSTRSEKSSVEK